MTVARDPTRARPLSEIPGRRSFLGIRTLLSFKKEPIGFLLELSERFGDIASFRLGPYRAVLINHPDYVRDLWVSQRQHIPRQADQTEIIRKMDGENLFTLTGYAWSEQRRVIQQAWRKERMDLLFEAAGEEIARRVSRWQSRDFVDMNDEMIEAAICVAGRCLFGEDFAPRCQELLAIAKLRSEVLLTELGSPVQLPDAWPLPHKRKKRQMIKTMDELFYGLIEARRDDPSEDDVISLLLREAPSLGLSDRGIRDHANMLFQAGVDDVSTVLTWMFECVARNPTVQDRVRQELAEVSDGGRVNYSAYPQLEYAQCVAKEALRLYPSTWLFGAREADQDIELDGYRIPRGSWVLVSPFVTHRRSEFFDAPATFDPDRFERFPNGSPQRNAWFPFGLGPRGCAGVQLSMVTLVQALVGVLGRYRLSPPREFSKPVGKVTVRPESPPIVGLQPLA